MPAPPDFLNIPQNVEWIGPDDPAYALSGLAHCARIPSTAGPDNRAPLAVLLHGWGGHEGMMWVFSKAIPQGIAIITPRAPLERPGSGYTWYQHTLQTLYPDQPIPRQPDENSLLDSLDSLRHFLDTLQELYPVDLSRLVLVGFSQGAAMAGLLAQQRPGVALGIAMLAGYWLPLPGRPAHNTASLAGLPVFIAQGSSDEIIVPVVGQRTRDAYTSLEAAVTYGEYPTAHKVSAQGIRDLGVWITTISTTPDQD